MTGTKTKFHRLTIIKIHFITSLLFTLLPAVTQSPVLTQKCVVSVKVLLLHHYAVIGFEHLRHGEQWCPFKKAVSLPLHYLSKMKWYYSNLIKNKNRKLWFWSSVNCAITCWTILMHLHQRNVTLNMICTFIWDLNKGNSGSAEGGISHSLPWFHLFSLSKRGLQKDMNDIITHYLRLQKKTWWIWRWPNWKDMSLCRCNSCCFHWSRGEWSCC